jgi:hypothetical protein
MSGPKKGHGARAVVFDLVPGSKWGSRESMFARAVVKPVMHELLRPYHLTLVVSTYSKP